jgi:hypothetical protein
LQPTAAALVPGSNQPVSFGGKRAATVAPGMSVRSDPVTLPFVHDPAAAELLGRKLGVSFHLVGESGRMTWNAKADGILHHCSWRWRQGRRRGRGGVPVKHASWYFLDALDMTAPANARAVVAFGDSIMDGTASTMNGDDRWSDVLARRLHAVYGNKSRW